MMSAEQFDRWCDYHRIIPLDDQSNHHWPLAQLDATMLNINRPQGAPAVKAESRLLFGRTAETDIEDQLEEGNW
jgi:hypothetical protein